MDSENKDVIIDLSADTEGALEFIRGVEETIEAIRTGEIHGEYFEF